MHGRRGTASDFRRVRSRGGPRRCCRISGAAGAPPCIAESLLMPSIFTRMASVAAICAFAFALSSCVDDDTTPDATRYHTAVTRILAQYNIPGAVASVRAPGAPEWKEAFGYGNLAARTPMDLQNHFSIRSITKAYTVTVILQLVRDKALSLDDKLESYVPGIPNGKTITIADLAGMQSGIADYSSNPEFLALVGADLGHAFTERQLVDYAIPDSPHFAPGAQYEYSNTNTVLLGMIVEMLTGVTLAEALEARILAPLALTGTTYPSVVPLPPPYPTPYDVLFATGAAEALDYLNPTALAGSGAMVSTLDDLQTWGQALGDGRLIGAELQVERVNRSRVVTNGPTYDRYGLGIGILKGWWGHTGSGLGFQAATFYDPRTRATIAVAVNATPRDGPPNLNYAEEMFRALADVVAPD